MLKNIACFVCIGAWMVSPVLADTLWMANGDRLTGTLRVLDGPRLVIETSYAGTLSVNWSQVATLETQAGVLLKRQGQSEGAVFRLESAGQGFVRLQAVDTTQSPPEPLALNQITQLMRPKPLEQAQDLAWKGQVDLGLDHQRSETQDTEYNLALETQVRHGVWRHQMQSAYRRQYTDEQRVQQNWELQYALDHFLTDQWFWQGRFEFKRDQIEDVSRQRTLGLGLGYQLWDDELGAFSLAALVDHSDYQFTDQGADQDFRSLTARWVYNRYLLGKKLELFSSGEFGKPLSGAISYTLDSQLGVRYRINEWISVHLKTEKDRVQSHEGDLDETRYSIGLGVGW